MNFKSIITVFFIVVLLSSCNSYKNIAYLKGVETLSPQQLAEARKLYSPKIMPGDILIINVNAVNSVAALPFNLPLTPVPSDASTKGVFNTVGSQTYIVDSSGNINFPVLGALHIAGNTREGLEKMLKDMIYPQYITEEPIVTARFANYSVSVLGEVQMPGTYPFPSEKVTLLDALAAAGDMTIYGRRDNVLLKREKADGSNEYVRLNLQDKNVVLSPYFYMQQNDVIYVEPNKAKGNSSSIGSTESVTISVVSTLIGIVNLIATFTR